jgi:hypothetical protein
MRTGKWRDAGIACAVVLAWHVMLGWILLRQFRFEPSPAADAAIRVVFLEPRAAPPMPRASTPGPHAPATVRRTPLVAAAKPLPAKALTAAAPPRQSLSADFLDQASAEARRQSPIDFGPRDPFAARARQLPAPGAGRFRMRPARSPRDLVAAVGAYLLAPRGYDADPCPRNRENIGNLMAGGDSASLQQEIEFEQRHCRP